MYKRTQICLIRKFFFYYYYFHGYENRLTIIDIIYNTVRMYTKCRREFCRLQIHEI